MIMQERQEFILKELLRKRSVSVAELSKYFEVSFETVRRDLAQMEKEGVVTKIHGGAVLTDRVTNDLHFSDLKQVMVHTKYKMARCAFDQIKASDSIYIDFSTTCGQMASIIVEAKIPINVMTSSLDVITTLEQKRNISLLSVGGEWDMDARAFMGSAAITTIGQYHVDKAFVSCRALSIDYGISDKNEVESRLRRAIIYSANHVYLVVDHTKFDHMAFVKTAGFERISTVITDEKLPERWEKFFDSNGIKILYA